MDILNFIPTEMKKIATTNGGEYAGPCPWCGGTDRFRAWPDEDESGRYWCRQCERHGDGIELIRELEGVGYQEARQRLGLLPDLRYTGTVVPVSQRAAIAVECLPMLEVEARERSLSNLRRGTEAPTAPTGDIGNNGRSQKIAAELLNVGTSSIYRAKSVNIAQAPPKAWQDAAWSFAEECDARLWTDEGAKALAWLRGRGLTDEAIRTASFGFNPDGTYLQPPAWGMEKGVKIERGITIPWVIGGELWKLNVRTAGKPKYKCVTGSKNALYNGDEIRADRPVALVEGEIDAWSIVQEAHSIAWAVATGSTHGSRQGKWIARLTCAPLVLVAYDSDKPGEDAAKFWTDNLPNAIRWRPYWSDANQMLQDGADIQSWIAAGLRQRKAA